MISSPRPNSVLSDICEHSNTEVRLRPDVNGNPRCQRQCAECGESVGNWIKLPLGYNHLPKWDDNLFEAWHQRRLERKQNEFEDRRRAYHEYLKTPEWRAISRLVRERNPTCEGCGQRPSTQAHHLTYEHIGEEFLWELAAICDECHERVHGSGK